MYDLHLNARDQLSGGSKRHAHFLFAFARRCYSAMFLGVGIDILSLARFEGFVQRRGVQAAAKRICCPRELDEFASLKPSRQINYLSSRFVQNRLSLSMIPVRVVADGFRWAIKEAGYKALSPYFLTSFHSFDMSKHASGQPSLRLVAPLSITGVLKPEDVQLMTTISHDAGVLAAVVVALRTDAVPP